MSARERYLYALEAEHVAACSGVPLPSHDLAALRAAAEAERQCVVSLTAYYPQYGACMAQHEPGTRVSEGYYIDADDLRAALKSGASVERLLAALDEATREGER